jgi:hypothetical protein
MSPRGKGSVTDEHKAAMAQGRAEGRAISAYLDALAAHKPKRGRKRTPESIDKRLAAIDDGLATANSINRLTLIQERLDLQAEKAAMGETVDLTALEDAFAAAAKGYSERKGISLAAWKEMGVPADVLKKAGITK